MSINWIDKMNLGIFNYIVEYPLNSKKVYTIDACSNMDESKSHFAKWKKPDWKYMYISYIHILNNVKI